MDIATEWGSEHTSATDADKVHASTVELPTKVKTWTQAPPLTNTRIAFQNLRKYVDKITKELKKKEAELQKQNARRGTTISESEVSMALKETALAHKKDLVVVATISFDCHSALLASRLWRVLAHRVAFEVCAKDGFLVVRFLC